MIFKISTLVGFPLKFAEHLRILLVNISRLFTSLYHNLNQKKAKFLYFQAWDDSDGGRVPRGPASVRRLSVMMW